MSEIRVRFAPSPTGGLHIGGLRTALYNYLFAKQKGGKFIVRIEDTDRARMVAGAEKYIFKCLTWCHIEPDESVAHGGNYGPYRQSERKDIYMTYVEQLVREKKAYLAFETSEELTQWKEKKEDFKYNFNIREKLNNSLNMSEKEVLKTFHSNKEFVVRLKVEANRKVTLDDMVKGKVTFNTDELDDKILLKRDKMPTYHLAVVIDDTLMKISHVFRGEEWLSSYPIHYLLYESLGCLEHLPSFIHLPLILKPSGQGKLSKREADKLNIPIFPLNWPTLSTENKNKGYKETGFLSEGLLNFLAKIGWDNREEKEYYKLIELVEKFNIKDIQKSSGKFDYEKAKWINHQHIIHSDGKELYHALIQYIKEKDIENPYPTDMIKNIIGLIKERCYLTSDVIHESIFFFVNPKSYDNNEINKLKEKLDIEKILRHFLTKINAEDNRISKDALEEKINQMVLSFQIKKGFLLVLLRLVCIGQKRGAGMIDIIIILGLNKLKERIHTFLHSFCKE